MNEYTHAEEIMDLIWDHITRLYTTQRAFNGIFVLCRCTFIHMYSNIYLYMCTHNTYSNICQYTQRKPLISHGTTSPIYTRHNAPSTACMCCVDIFPYICTPTYIYTYGHTMYIHMCVRTRRGNHRSHMGPHHPFIHDTARLQQHALAV